MRSPMIVFILLLCLLVTTSLAEESREGGTEEPQVPGEVPAFENWSFEPHSVDYDSLATNPMLRQLLPIQDFPEDGHYEIRWLPRATALAFAYGSNQQDRGLKRAFELAYWQGWNVQRMWGRGDDADRHFAEYNIPLTIGYMEVNDLLTIDRVLYRLEEGDKGE